MKKGFFDKDLNEWSSLEIAVAIGGLSIWAILFSAALFFMSLSLRLSWEALKFGWNWGGFL